jgi:hypothetical protein
MIIFFLKAVSVFAVAFWPWVAVTSAMMLGGPDATRDKARVRSTILILYYPVLIAGIYWMTDSSLWGVEGRTLSLAALIAVTVALYAFGHFRMAWSLLQGVGNSGYSVTRGGVYYNGERLPAIDSKSFGLVEQHKSDASQASDDCSDYYADRNHVIRIGKIIANADPASFHRIQKDKDKYKQYRHEDFWADAHTVFYDGKALEDSQPSSFVRLSEYYSQSNGLIYHAHHKLTDADASSFTVLSEHFAADKHRIFYNHTAILPMADPSSFQLITLQGSEPSFATDDQYVYLLYTDVHSRPLEFVDRKTVAFLSESYFKDAHAVYHRSFEKVKALANADPSTFELVRYSATTPYDARDKNGAYDDGIARCEAIAS